MLNIVPKYKIGDDVFWEDSNGWIMRWEISGFEAHSTGYIYEIIPSKSQYRNTQIKDEKKLFFSLEEMEKVYQDRLNDKFLNAKDKFK